MDGSHASRARIKVSAGWSGWVGIPVGHFSGLAVGGNLNSIQIRAIGSQTESPVNVGEVVYFDEFWLTSANTMPGLTDDQLLGKVTSAPIWTLNDGDVNVNVVGQSNLTNLTTAANSTLNLVDGKGLGGKNALKVTLTNAVANTEWYHLSLANLPSEFGTVVTSELTGVIPGSKAEELMLWIYVDGSDLTHNARLNYGFESAGTTTGLWTYGGVQYYIDNEGKVQSMNMGAQSNGNGVISDGKSRGRVTVDAGYVGWIGIPVNMFGSTTQADLTALGEFCFALCAGIDRNNNNTAVSLAVGDALYIGDMWLSTKDASGNWNIPAPAAKPAN